MSFQVPKTAGFVRQVALRAWSAHRDYLISAVLRGVVLGFVLLQAAVYGSVYGPCEGVAHDQGGVRLLQDGGVAVSPRSRVSARKKSETLHIRVVSGEVLLKPRGTRGYPMVVTAGSALIRHIEGSVCIGVEGKRTVIAVLEGAVDISVLTTGAPRGEITLRTGDRLELRREHSAVMFHFAGDELISMPGCTDAIMRWAWADTQRQ